MLNDTFTPYKMIILSIRISVKEIQIITMCDLRKNDHNWEFVYAYFSSRVLEPVCWFGNNDF